jgi:hypothetical protein
MRPARWFSLVLLLAPLAAVLLVVGQRVPRPADRPEHPELTGRVRDAHGPVADALVRFQGQRLFSRTDAQGRFRLPRFPASPARVTAWKEGYFIAGAEADSSVLLRLTPLPKEDDPDYAWVDPTPDPTARHNCGNCHGEIHREWAGSAHARAATGRHFLNLYDGSDWHGRPGAGWSLLDQHPDGAGVCTACHAPSVRPADPAYFDLRLARGVAAQGVHCDYCHKVADAGLGTLGLTFGQFGLKMLRPAGGQLFFGPLDDVDRGEDAHAPLYRESRYCASCHEGTIFGVPVYTTYSEWLASPARAHGKQCQDCHMKPTGRLTNLAPGKGGIERDPWTLGNHRFFAGSLEEMLRDSLRLEVEAVRASGCVRVPIALEAERVGHCVPTGFIDRQLLLVVDGVDANGRRHAASRSPLLPAAAGQELSGRAGLLFARLLRDAEGRAPVPFWQAGSTLTDTRLIPGRREQAVFLFPAEVERVRVRLIYRRFWKEVAEAKRWPDDDVTIIDRAVSVRPIPFSGEPQATAPQRSPAAPR